MSVAAAVTRPVGRRLVTRRFDENLRALALSLPQTGILSALTLIAGPVKPSVLADLLGMERSTMSRNLALTDGRGWTAPAATSVTGRSMSVAITPRAEPRWHLPAPPGGMLRTRWSTPWDRTRRPASTPG